MAEFHISFMLSSLLYVANTIGWVAECLWPVQAKQLSYFAKRFLAGTLLVESIINQLGLFSPTSGHWSWFPKISFFSQFFSAKQPQPQPQKVIGHSLSQARLLAVLLSSVLHGMFFIMMGSKGGFWLTFSAYILSSFARSILTGKNCFFSRAFFPYLKKLFGSISDLVSPFVHHGMSDQRLTFTARNAYFASGFKQSIGYAYGLWSASLSTNFDILL